MQMANDCARHAGRHNEVHRAKLDGIMKTLPKNQSGGPDGGRHKCPYCAYERGFEDGLQRATEIIRDFILKESRSSVNI